MTRWQIQTLTKEFTFVKLPHRVSLLYVPQDDLLQGDVSRMNPRYHVPVCLKPTCSRNYPLVPQFLRTERYYIVVMSVLVPYNHAVGAVCANGALSETTLQAVVRVLVVFVRQKYPSHFAVYAVNAASTVIRLFDNVITQCCFHGWLGL